jgi:hypothetical protein
MLLKNILFSDGTYKTKLKTLTNVRLVSHYLWSILFGLIILTIFTRITQGYYVSTFLTMGVKYEFSLTLFFIFWLLTAISLLVKVLVYQNYEEHLNSLELLARIILVPRYQTVFLFVNSVITTYQINILNLMVGKVKKYKGQEGINLEVYLAIYR